MSQPAGYSGTPLPQKLGIGEDDAVALIGAPGWLEDTLAEVPGVAEMHTDLDGAAPGHPAQEPLAARRQSSRRSPLKMPSSSR